ncbi:rifin [Plasmodium sp. gorilla clade G1]|nr:rifin [Plasmodium sp. gorilla clade G1]
MKVHYINILLFALPLNILVHNKKKIYTMQRHKHTNRSLCECDLYMPNYDKDPQMKEVMENFNKQTQKRFHEFDENMVKNRQKCKDKCDKEIQKIILKDKLEKQMEQHFDMLHTEIQSDAITTCVCEKSLADKVEKGCLKCGYGLGTVAPTVGLIGSVAVHMWKPVALKAAIKAALNAAANHISAAAEAEGIEAGKNAVIVGIKDVFITDKLTRTSLQSLFISKSYDDVSNIINFITIKKDVFCGWKGTLGDDMCPKIYIKLGTVLENGHPGLTDDAAILQKANEIVTQAKGAAEAKAAQVAAAQKLAIETTEQKAIEVASYNWYSAIGYSILAILIIVLIMVIIYLILHYRRKKKIKKKLQYIKLLEK